MSSATRILLLVTLAASLSAANGWGWGWDWSFEWSTNEPANCPHENHETHVCSALQSTNATCITIKCCADFADDEDYDEYDESSETEDDDDNVYYVGKFTDHTCSLCYTSKACSVYRCYRRCCDGYEQDHYGRCQNETGQLQCKNGGSLLGDYCLCPEGFTGKSCEIPICHCDNGGECDVKDGKSYCNCAYGYYGDKCEKSNCTMKCYNGGECYKDGTYEICKCPHNYFGKQCEQRYQSDTCPPPYYHYYCASRCTGNSDCNNDEVCCKEGCSTVCRKPKAEYCLYEGRQYRVGQSYQPDPCQNCTCAATGDMECSTKMCDIPRCANGRPAETKSGQCCPSCPGKPTIYNCPTEVLYLKTSYYTDQAWLNERNTFIKAVDARNQKLEVKYRPPYVRHCHCTQPEKRMTAVKAAVTDSNGNVATCTFKVAVSDIYQPIFRTCPEDIFVFENEVVEWREPKYGDNVEVVGKTCTSKRNGHVFPVGNHTLTYKIWDFDENVASCNFHVSVTKHDTAIENMPQGLRDRSKDSAPLAIILGPVVGGIVLLVVLVLLLFCCCRRKRESRSSRNARGASRQPPAYDNNIYAEPGEIDVKLPPYSGLPQNPPAYSITGSVKDLTYMSIPPPSYTNPGYETLQVHRQTPTESVKSGSVKSMKSEKK